MPLFARRQPAARPRRDQMLGLSIVELMVSLLIGLFLIGGVIAAFIATKQTSQRKAT